MQQTFFIVDAFVDPEKPFSGNPAAVILLNSDNDISDECKQKVAAQFDLSETMFVSCDSQLPDGHFLIRFFTPSNEVDLCGHGTMASSYVLYNEQHQLKERIDPNKPIQFRTKFGAHLECAFHNEQFILNFPLNEPLKLEPAAHPWLDSLHRDMLGTEVELADIQWSPTTKKLLLRVADGELVLNKLQPDFNRLLRMDTAGMVRGLIVTQMADFQRDQLHFCSRYFSPWNGINEDPVTGSAFTVLTPYWKKVYKDEDENILYAKQMSQRSGLVQCQIKNHRVLIGGKARTFCKGIFNL